MAQLGRHFDATQVDPAAPREVLPAGKYQVQIVRSEMKHTSKGGEMLELEMDVLDGPHQGRKLWDRLNLVNANSKAVEIAERTLSAICHAVGVLAVSDSEELHFRPMLATVKVKPAGPDGQGVMRDAQNEVSGYEPVQGGHAAAVRQPRQQQTAASNPPPRQAQQQTAQQQRPAGSTAATPPWRRTAT